MAENKESAEFLGKLAMIADASQSLIEGKVSVVIEVYQQEFDIIKQNFDKNTAEDSEIFASVTHIATLDCINPGYKNEGGRLYKKYYAKGAGESFPASSWVNIPQHANEQAKIIYKYFCNNKLST